MLELSILFFPQSNDFLLHSVCSLKCQSYSRAYIDFKHPDDDIEFANFFHGHVFVNEKGS